MMKHYEIWYDSNNVLLKSFEYWPDVVEAVKGEFAPIEGDITIEEVETERRKVGITRGNRLPEYVSG